MKQLLTALTILIAATFTALSQPAIQIINPTNGALVQGGVLLPFWVTAQAPIPGVMLVEQYIDGKLVNDYLFLQHFDITTGVPVQTSFFDVFVTHYWRTKGQGPFLLQARVIDWAGIEVWADPVVVLKQ